MKMFLLLILVLLVISAVLTSRRGSAAREQRHLEDARAEAQEAVELAAHDVSGTVCRAR